MGKYYLGTGTQQINFQVVDSTGVVSDLNLSGLYLSITGKAADADKLDNFDSSYFRNAANLTGAYTGQISGSIANADTLDGYDSSYFLNGANITGFISGNVKINYLNFTTGLNLNPSTAQVTWTDTPGTMSVGLLGSNVDLNVGFQNYEFVTNRGPSTLTKGTAVYVSGAQGNRPVVAPAIGIADSTSAATFGLMAENVATMSDGYAITQGLLTNLNTTGFAEGASLYLSPTISGAITSTKPQAPQHSVLIGFCVRSHQAAGEILVKIQNGVEIDELHDVRISSVQNNDILRYNLGSGLWYNSDTLALNGTGSHYVSGNLGIGTSSPSGRLQVDGAAIVTGNLTVDNGTLFVDAVNDRVGVGTTSPNTKLHVAGNAIINDLQINTAVGGGPASTFTFQSNTASGVNDAFIFNSSRSGGNYGNFEIQKTGTAKVHVGLGSLDPNTYFNIDGNFGVGTTSPSYKFDVAGTANTIAAKIGAASQYLTIGSYTPNSAGATLGYNTTQYLGLNAFFGVLVGRTYVSNTSTAPADGMAIQGNLGVGTTAPGGKLEVNFTAATAATALILRTSDSAGNGAIRWQNSAGTNQAGIGSSFNVADTGAIEFLNGATTNVIFRSSGNVGIGTTNPTTLLHVNGAATFAGAVTVSSTTPSTTTSSGALVIGNGTSGGLGVGGNVVAGGFTFGTAPNASYPFYAAGSTAGTPVSMRISHSDGTNATSNARIILDTASGGGDPFINFISGAVEWSLGVDNSASDVFKLSRSGAIGTTDALTIDGSNAATFAGAVTSQISAANTANYIGVLNGSIRGIQLGVTSANNISWQFYNGSVWQDFLTGNGGTLAATFAGAVNITGNLTVNGTTTTVNSTTVTVDDPIITLGGDTAPTVDDNKDRGVEFRWHNGTIAKIGFFGFDDSTGYLTFIPDATNTSEVFSGSVGDIQAANFRGTLIGSLSNALTAGSYLTGTSYNGSAAVTFAVDATSVNTVSKVVARDASGNFSAGTITAALSGNATTATTLQTARNIAGVSFNGSADISITGQNITNSIGTAANDIEVAKYMRWKNYGNSHVLIDTSAGTSPTGSAVDKVTPGFPIDTTTGVNSWGNNISLMGWNGSSTYGVRVDRARNIDNQANSATITAATANTASTIVLRDASGNFSAGTVTAALSGNASTATTWQTARNLSIGGTSKSVNGSADVTWTTSEIGINNGTLTLAVSGTGLSGSSSFTANQSGNSTFTVTSNATSSNTASTIVARDASGNFSAGAVTASFLDISGNSTQNVGLARFTNNYAAGGVYYPTASFIQTRGAHSYGIVSEFRTNTAGDSDRPSILFYGAQGAHSWQVGQITSGWGAVDNFGIGYRASNTPSSFASWPTNYFTITTGGNVGIGQTSPSYKLEVETGVGDSNGIRVRDSATGVWMDLRRRYIECTGGDFWINSQSSSFDLRTANSSRLFIALGGNIGIGTTAPSAKLTINTAFATTNGVTVSSDSAGHSQLILRKAASKAAYSVMAWENQVFIGAGIYYENAAWVHHNINTNNSMFVFSPGTGATWYASNNSSGSWNVANDTTLWNDSGIWTNLVQSTRSGNSYFTGGNIGIGTTGPVGKLEIVTTSDTAGAPSAYDNKYFTVGTGGATGGSVFISYDQTNNRGYIGALSPSVAWRNLILQGGGGNVGIGTATPGYKLEVNGSFAATTKSFVIHHPTKQGKKLRYGSLEGPENGVYVRGKTTSKVIELPDYWTKLVDPESISVQLTAIGSHQKLYVEKIENNKVYIANENLLAKSINCFFYILAERADVEKLQVEIDA